MSDSVLVVAAHPDDEVLGAGGVMAKHAQAGDAVYVLILGEGVSSRDEARTEDNLQARRDEFENLKASMRRAHEVLGVTKSFHENLADNRFDGVELLDIVKRVEKVFDQVKPNIVYTHHAGDLNVDHRLTLDAVMAAARALPGATTRRLLSFEVLSSTEWAPPAWDRAFLPNVFAALNEEQFEKKCRAMQCYGSELREFPHPRSLEALRHQAALWGAKSGLGVAEAFVLQRECLY